jgi:hypothetical protein
VSTIAEIIKTLTKAEHRWMTTVRWHRGWHGDGPLRNCADVACQEAFHEYIGQYEVAEQQS